MSIDLNQCDKACFSCIKNYKNKFSLKQGQLFDISCKGIPDEYVSEHVAAGMTEDEIATARAILDPVSWAAETLDWHCLDPDGSIWQRKNPEEYFHWLETNEDDDKIFGKSRYHRPYQANMLRCLHGDTNVFMANGTVKQIKDIQIGDKVVTYNEGRKKTQSSYKVLNKWNNGKRDLYRIELNNGDILKVTNNHPILSWFHEGRINKLVNKKSFKRTYKSLQDGLSVGDKVYTLNHFDIFGKEDNIDQAKLLGYIVTDGYVSNSGIQGTKHVVQFSNTRKKYVEEFSNLIASVFNVSKPDIVYYPARVDNEGVYHKEYWSSYIFNRSHPLLVFLRSINCTNKDNREISILNFAFKYKQEALQYFLNRCWSGDGCIYNQNDPKLQYKRTYISFSSGNMEYLELFRLLLKKIGIYTSHIYIDNKKTSKTINLTISRIEDIETFLNFTGPIFGKESQCKLALTETSKRSHNHRRGNLKTLSRTSIKRIEYIGKEEVWDIEVDKRHNFVANGIVVHNCTSKQKVFRIGRQAGKTESLVISMLFHMFTKPGIPHDKGFRIVVITPYQTQIELIFERMAELLRSSPLTSNALKRYVKAPNYTMELFNGSMVKGFTAGTKSGGNAESVRGQHGNMLVFDEADYLSSSDMDAALSIITNHPTATVWMSSTPSGKREKFYQTCFAPDWQEFHYPSQVNPLWNSQKEKLFRRQLTEIGYKHEIEGNFGEQEEGVFQNSYVEAAHRDYKYGDYGYKKSWSYMIGVDWNDIKNGTTITTVGFNPDVQKFMIVDREVVSRDGWTQLTACQKISELNSLWHPMAIYLDKGFGGTQFEVIRKYGIDSLKNPNKGPGHPDSKLHIITKQYDFGSKIDTFDLFTRQPVKKDAKPFLVESTVRRFEAQDIIFSVHDKDLTRQLLGYVVDHVTQAGRPVYKANDEEAGDHALDSLMLAIVGFILEVTPHGKPKYATKIGFSGQFGSGKDLSTDDVIFQRNKLAQEKHQRAERKPGGRTNVLEQQSLFPTNSLPAANTSEGNKPKPWSYNGFLRDDPSPRTRTLGEAMQEAKARTGPSRRRGGRPRRKNI